MKTEPAANAVFAYTFDGAFAGGLPNGRGKLTLHDGSRYIGQFKDGKRHGKGVQTYADARTYAGDWVEGL